MAPAASRSRIAVGAARDPQIGPRSAASRRGSDARDTGPAADPACEDAFAVATASSPRFSIRMVSFLPNLIVAVDRGTEDRENRSLRDGRRDRVRGRIRSAR